MLLQITLYCILINKISNTNLPLDKGVEAIEQLDFRNDPVKVSAFVTKRLQSNTAYKLVHEGAAGRKMPTQPQQCVRTDLFIYFFKSLLTLVIYACIIYI